MTRFILASALLGATAVLLPEIRAGWTVRYKYPIGSTADAIEHEYRTRLPLVRSGVVLVPPVTVYTKRHALGYSLYAPLDCVYVQFNFLREVSHVRKVTPLSLLQVWWTHE